MADRVSVSVGVNGTTYVRDVEPRDLLVYFLREELGLTGTHVGCDTSQCGACTVLLDNRPVKSCTLFAVQADGRQITTIEGVAATDGKLRPVARGLLERAWPAVWLLHTRLHHDRDGAAEEHSQSDRGADSQGPRRQSVPLHGLHEHRQSRSVGEHIGEHGCQSDCQRRGSGGLGHVCYPDAGHEDPSARRSAPDHRRRPLHRRPGSPGHLDDGHRAQSAPACEDHPHWTSPARERCPAWSPCSAGPTSSRCCRAPIPSRRRSWPKNTPSPSASRLPSTKSPTRASRSPSCVAESRKLAVDAAALVEVDYEPLPAVTDLFKALEAGSPSVHDGAADNLAWDLTYTPDDIVKDAFAQADVVVKERVLQQRLAPSAIEPRGVVAEYSQYDDQMTMWVGHAESAHPAPVRRGSAGHARNTAARHLARRRRRASAARPTRIPRTIWCPPPRNCSSGACAGSRPAPKPCTGTTHGRGEIFDVEVAAKRDGSLLAMKVTQYLDAGAYIVHARAPSRRARACSSAAPTSGRAASPREPSACSPTACQPTFTVARGDPRPRTTGRTHRRQGGPGAGHGPGRHPPEEFHQARRVSVHQQFRAGVRLGQLRRVA